MSWKDYLVDETLIIEGNFNAISSGLLGGWKRVRFLFNHTVNDFDLSDPIKYYKSVAKKYGLTNYFGLLTSVSMDKLAMEKFGCVTAYVTAGVGNPNERIEFEKIGTINIILVIDGKMSGGGMINAVITATEAKTKVLLELGYNFTGTGTDAIIVASTDVGKYYEYSGPKSELGQKIWNCVSRAVKNSLGEM